MSVNGITNITASEAYSATAAAATTKVKTKNSETETKKNTIDAGVIYEPSSESNSKSASKVYKQDSALIDKLKADAEAQTAQLRQLVEQMISKQGGTLGQTDDMWSFLASGDFTVDAETKAKAQSDIAEDGYWGVNQTSDRILDFAKALSGGDPDMIDKMRNAFEKGFKEATKSWGKDLPSLSQDTYNAVMDKFDKWAEEAGQTE